jgi:hypothetical protein
MPKYEDSKIYTIYGGAEIYYGATTQVLSQKMATHRDEYKKGPAKKTASYLFHKYGVENCTIQLVELFPCTSIEELDARKAHWVRNNICINNRTKFLNAAYYKEHKEEIAEQRAKYRKKNKKLLDKREAKRQLIRKAIVPTVCACGGSYKDYNKRQHEQSKRHKKHLNQTVELPSSPQTET